MKLVETLNLSKLFLAQPAVDKASGEL